MGLHVSKCLFKKSLVMTKILLVEEDVLILELVQFNLEKEGYLVHITTDGEQGLALIEKEKPDLIILGRMLPVLNGYEVCKSLRLNKETESIPIIIISARNNEEDKIICLELGADDYITKPFSSRELLARIKARLREGQRKYVVRKKPLRWGELEIDTESYIVTLANRTLNLTVKEFNLLVILVTNPYQIFKREYLMQKVWGNLTNIDTRTINAHVHNLRNKLKALGPMIDTVRGVEYRLSIPDNSEDESDYEQI
ncbi:Transcriptional regulatory protein YycF [Candidatus Desulfosporosinus infrequens]|uniref:Stage 0 sporulation protein A homolog n=1 Tax=Candidatus Desulfosporosinus infrequens TaxID=2043169 RepID=A0A2U3LGG5_9FIRM|nr:Transcriptional regulatory protein YycF [Candidatus Desulfosporosinus infrequens]